MKTRVLFYVFLLFATGFLFADPELSGVLESTVNFTAGAGDAPARSWGIEEYANLRLRVRTGEKAVFYSAFNVIAAAGNFLEAAYETGNLLSTGLSVSATPFIYGHNYAAALELERLYLRINGDYIDTEAGLLRMSFGYGQVWGSSDFLNLRNPLAANARPRGVLGTTFSFYPADSLKLMVFAAAPRDPLESGGGGFLPGLSLDQHWDRASLQFLYAFQTPLGGSKFGIHRFGLSLKADLELGFVADALYTLNPESPEKIEGLSAGGGFDYNFLDGDLYVLFEYLFNGSSSATALSRRNHHYLSGTILYRFNDYCSASLSTVFCFDDLSFTPYASLEYEVFQGFSLSLSAFVPLDQKVLSGGARGELGPVAEYTRADNSIGEIGAWFRVYAGARLRF